MILCTGNPEDQTVASAVRKKFSNVDFASRATGYDLRFWDAGSKDFFCDNIKKYNVFINSSFICNDGQMQLLEVTHEIWTKNNINGHIINIGSSAEWLGINSPYGGYSVQKRALRDRGLQLDSHRIKVTHITLGGLNDGKPGHENWLDLAYVADAILWVVNHPMRIPLLALQK